MRAHGGSFVVPHAGALGVVCRSGGCGMARVAVGGHTHLMLGGHHLRWGVAPVVMEGAGAGLCWSRCSGLRPVALVAPVMMREGLP